MNSVSSMQSALSLAQLGKSKMLDASRLLGTANPDQILDSFVSMNEAKNSVKAAGVLMRTQQEMDQAILDIFA